MRQPTRQDFLDTLKAVQDAGFYGYFRDCYHATGELISYKLLETKESLHAIDGCIEYDTLHELHTDMRRLAEDYHDRYHPRGHDYVDALCTLDTYSMLPKGVKL